MKRNSGFFYNLSTTNLIIIINTIIFVLVSAVLYVNSGFIEYIALKPENILHGKYIWTILTSMFMHGGLWHLIVNMFSLFFIGTFIEQIIGKKRFWKFYLVSGIIAGLVFSVLAYFFGNSLIGARVFGSPSEFGVGASGAIFGLAGLLAVLIPRKKVYLIAGPLVAIILQVILSNIIPGAIMQAFDILITIYIFISIFMMFSFNPRTRRIALPIEMPFWMLPIAAILPLMIIGLFVSLPIGNTAHLGGLIVGLIYGFYLRNKYKKKTMLLNRYMR